MAPATTIAKDIKTASFEKTKFEFAVTQHKKNIHIQNATNPIKNLILLPFLIIKFLNNFIFGKNKDMDYKHKKNKDVLLLKKNYSDNPYIYYF